MYTAISRLSEKNVHATIPKGNNLWDMISTLFQTTAAVEPTFVAFL